MQRGNGAGADAVRVQEELDAVEPADPEPVDPELFAAPLEEPEEDPEPDEEPEPAADPDFEPGEEPEERESVR